MVEQLVLSRDRGSSQLAKLRKHTSTLPCPQGDGSFTWEPISSSPVGEPPQVCGTVFPELCFVRNEYCYSVSGSQASSFWVPSPKLQCKIPQMARGWESKSVEQQQEGMSEQRKIVRTPISPDEQQRNRKREGLLLSRIRLTQQLQTASNLRHRQMLSQAIAELDRQLSSFEQVTDSISSE
jgi:hypothetical protein